MKMSITQHKTQQGVALIFALIVLLVLAMISTTALHISMMQEKMSSNMRDQETSFHAAEAALKEAENWILNLGAEPDPVTSCVAYPCVILYDPQRYAQDNNAAWWDANSASLSGGLLAGTIKQPQFYIEYLRFVPDSSMQIGTGTLTGKHYYRVTARGTGNSADAVVVLRATVARRF